MQIEIMAFWGFICLILIGLAELRPSLRMLGVIGCLLLVPLAFWVWTGGIEVQTGTTTTINTTTNTTIASSVEIGTEDITLNRAPVNLPYTNMGQLLTLLLLGSSIFGMFHYVTLMLPSEAAYSRM